MRGRRSSRRSWRDLRVGGGERAQLEEERRVRDRIDVLHPVVEAAVQRRGEVDQEGLEEPEAVAHPELGEVVVVVAVLPSERAQLEERLPEHRADLQEV